MKEIILPVSKLKFLYDRYNEQPEFYLSIVRQGDLYKKLYEDIKKNGIKNPFLVIEKDGEYITATGNIRIIVARDLGIEEVRCIILSSGNPKAIKEAKKFYYEVIKPFDSF